MIYFLFISIQLHLLINFGVSNLVCFLVVFNTHIIPKLQQLKKHIDYINFDEQKNHIWKEKKIFERCKIHINIIVIFIHIQNPNDAITSSFSSIKPSSIFMTFSMDDEESLT